MFSHGFSEPILVGVRFKPLRVFEIQAIFSDVYLDTTLDLSGIMRSNNLSSSILFI